MESKFLLSVVVFLSFFLLAVSLGSDRILEDSNIATYLTKPEPITFSSNIVTNVIELSVYMFSSFAFMFSLLFLDSGIGWFNTILIVPIVIVIAYYLFRDTLLKILEILVPDWL